LIYSHHDDGQIIIVGKGNTSNWRITKTNRHPNQKLTGMLDTVDIVLYVMGESTKGYWSEKKRALAAPTVYPRSGCT